MASRTLPGIGLEGFWTLGESWKTGGDSNWRRLSALVQLSVKSIVSVVPTSGMVDGDFHIVSTGADATKIAMRDLGAWVYFTPSEGWIAWVRDINDTYVFDGTAWVPLISKTTYVGAFAAGVMTANEIVGAYVAPVGFSFAAGTTGHVARSLVAATASTTLKIQKSSAGVLTDIGTIAFGIGTTTATVTITSATIFAVGDLVIVRAPASADATLADVAVSIRGTLS